MESIFFRSWWVPALRGLLGVLFAVLAIGWPGLTLLSSVALFAAYEILAGIASLAGALRRRTGGQVHRDAVILGIVSIGAGLVAAYHPAATAVCMRTSRARCCWRWACACARWSSRVGRATTGACRPPASGPRPACGGARTARDGIG